ncbi:hypothetical protein B0H10DRAFT_1957629 [Mycena sp. CBHHK59/15]|nr:hypothetical protein B0H10DRAFT_1957629 [Mycena sp. CBHHK59/15]
MAFSFAAVANCHGTFVSGAIRFASLVGHTFTTCPPVFIQNCVFLYLATSRDHELSKYASVVLDVESVRDSSVLDSSLPESSRKDAAPFPGCLTRSHILADGKKRYLFGLEVRTRDPELRYAKQKNSLKKCQVCLFCGPTAKE